LNSIRLLTNHMKQIKNIITSIKYGPHFRTQKEGNARFLKGNQFDDDFQLSLSHQSYVTIEEDEERALLAENDVIIAAKGFRNFAWKYSAEYGPCVASSLFYVAKLRTDVISPDYFAMVINASRIQHTLKNVGLGATIRAVPKNELLRVKIAIPPMEQQLKAVAIHTLVNEQISIERKILNRRLKIKKGLLNLLTEKQE